MKEELTRRNFLAAATAAASVVGLPKLAPGSSGQQFSPAQNGANTFRFVHLADMHVQPEQRADKGLIKCLAAVEALEPKPDFILTGGDLVMDVMGTDATRAKMLFGLYCKIFDDHTSIPVHECIGNHDVFGWTNRKGVTPNHPDYGKKMVQDFLGLPCTYYRFDHKGWRFFVLDDIQPCRGCYDAYIDEAQLDWLEKELAAKDPNMPAAVVCHIPILSITVLNGSFKDKTYQVPTQTMCRDAFKLAELFTKYKVRLALSGHTHQQDRVEYRGVTYICTGAVCGAWWKGPHKGFEEGFGVLDLEPGGGVHNYYHDYGWQPEPKA